MNAAGLIELLITLPTGIIMIILAFCLICRQNITLIHEYHHQNVQPQDIKAYTQLWGFSLLIMGICTGITGLIDFLYYTEIGWGIFTLGLIIGFFIGHHAQKKYNGSWFSLK